MSGTTEGSPEAPPRRRPGSMSVTAWLIIGLGIWFVASSIWPEGTGYAALSDSIGGEASLVRLAIGFLFLYMAGALFGLAALRGTVGRMVSEIRRFLLARQGGAPSEGSPPDPRNAKVEAAAILIGILRNGTEEAKARARDALRKLTGEDLGDGADAWDRWVGQHWR